MVGRRRPDEAPLVVWRCLGYVLAMTLRMGGRVVEGTGLENRQACKGLVGSNPTPSATYFF